MIEDVLFGFESYLIGSGVPPAQWAVVAMHLLDKKALSTWISFAQPLHNQGQVPTWEQFKSTLCSAFAHPDRQLAARQELLSVRQRNTVAEYVQRVRILVNRAGAPPPSDADLMLYFWKGLKSHIQDQSKVDPRTGAFWTSFESLSRHAILVDTQRPPSGREDKQFDDYKSKRKFPNRVSWADQKTKHDKSKNDKPFLKALRPISKQDRKRSRSNGAGPSNRHAGGGRGSGGQGRGGRGDRRPANCPGCGGQGDGQGGYKHYQLADGNTCPYFRPQPPK